MVIEKLAGIDIGSNAIRLLIMNVITEKKGKTPSFRKSALVRVPIRLGKDAFKSHECFQTIDGSSWCSKL
jgi:exopolyphosphatase/guanosine-5'-triphosphate,3'-diphosphate pyrophosphatase